jgi:aspartokinase
MYGVSKIHSEQNVMLITFPDASYSPEGLARHLQVFADQNIVVDMISQSAPHGTNIDFSFTTEDANLSAVMKALPALKAADGTAPLFSSGYSKVNLFGEEMVTSCGVAARALSALAKAGIDISLITTSDLDISLLIRSEDEDAALDVLNRAFALA